MAVAEQQMPHVEPTSELELRPEMRVDDVGGQAPETAKEATQHPRDSIGDTNDADREAFSRATPGPPSESAPSPLAAVPRRDGNEKSRRGLAIVVALVGIAGILLIVWQLSLLQSQLTLLQATVAESAHSSDTMARLADAATQANEIANQALIAASRPWVGVDTVEAGPVVANQPLNIEVLVRYSGRTPSTDVQGLFLVYISSIDNPPQLLNEPCGSCVRGVVLPNGIVSYKLVVRDSIMAPDEVQRIKDGKDTIWIVGRLDYHDADGDTHTTKSCLFYRGGGVTGFSACTDGNFAG
jgi:hypothetical protein